MTTLDRVFEVPVIDVSGWAAGSADTRAEIAASVGDACRSVGFMQIVGHDIPDRVRRGLTDAMDSFFSLSPDEKARSRASRASLNRGYTPPRAERLSYSLGVVSPDDLFEAFNVGITSAHFPGLELDGEVYAANIWPEAVPGFEGAVWTWFEHAAAQARTMTSIFATALGLPDGWFVPFTDHSIDVLRMNHYEVPEGVRLELRQLGMGAHTDYGIVTVLWADPVPGLEILRPDGSWHPVVPAPGAVLINLGDLLARWTNDQWMSTMHRVVPPLDERGRPVRRRSAAFFHDGNADALISTLEPCRGDGDTYAPVTVADHLAQKLAGSRGLELNEHAGREAARIVRVR